MSSSKLQHPLGTSIGVSKSSERVSTLPHLFCTRVSPFYLPIGYAEVSEPGD